MEGHMQERGSPWVPSSQFRSTGERIPRSSKQERSWSFYMNRVSLPHHQGAAFWASCNSRALESNGAVSERPSDLEGSLHLRVTSSLSWVLSMTPTDQEVSSFWNFIHLFVLTAISVSSLELWSFLVIFESECPLDTFFIALTKYLTESTFREWAWGSGFEGTVDQRREGMVPGTSGGWPHRKHKQQGVRNESCSACFLLWILPPSQSRT